MDLNLLLHVLTNKKYVELIKYDLHFLMEDEAEAYDHEIVDKVRGRYNDKNKVWLKFNSKDEEKTILFCFKQYDYEVVECSIGFDLKIKKHKLENEEKHLENRKNYLKFISRYVSFLFGTSEQEKYNKRANALIEKSTEKLTNEQ